MVSCSSCGEEKNFLIIESSKLHKSIKCGTCNTWIKFGTKNEVAWILGMREKREEVTLVKMSFSKAFEFIIETDLGIRLSTWDEDKVVKVQHPDNYSKMKTPYLYLESKNSTSPWLPSYEEMFSKDWCLVK